MHLLEWKCIFFNQSCPEICSYGSNQWQACLFQIITWNPVWTNDGIVYQCIYASQSFLLPFKRNVAWFLSKSLWKVDKDCVSILVVFFTYVISSLKDFRLESIYSCDVLFSFPGPISFLDHAESCQFLLISYSDDLLNKMAWSELARIWKLFMRRVADILKMDK